MGVVDAALLSHGGVFVVGRGGLLVLGASQQ